MGTFPLLIPPHPIFLPHPNQTPLSPPLWQQEMPRLPQSNDLLWFPEWRSKASLTYQDPPGPKGSDGAGTDRGPGWADY